MCLVVALGEETPLFGVQRMAVDAPGHFLSTRPLSRGSAFRRLDHPYTLSNIAPLPWRASERMRKRR